MPEQPSQDPAARALVYLASGSLGVGLAWILLRPVLPILQVVIPMLAGWWIWQRYEIGQQAQRETLNTSFYHLIQTHQGQVTILDLAMTAHVSAIAARQYLDSKAKEFSAQFEVTDQGDLIYLFPTLASLHCQAVHWQASDRIPSEPMIENRPILRQPLTQADLARRLGVSVATVNRKKHLPELTAWTRAKDPDQIGWIYLAQTRKFLPLE